MTSMSYKVQVNVALFENIDRLKQVPRPTGRETVQMPLMAPGNVRFTTGNITGVVCERRQTIPISHDGNGRQEVEPEGPSVGCRHQQSRNNGRFKCRFKVGKLNKLRKMLKLRLHVTLTRAVARGVDLMWNELKVNGGRHTHDTTLLGRTVSGVNAGGRVAPQHINRDINVTHGAESGTDIGDGCRAKPSPTVWAVESTTNSEHSEQVPAAGRHSNTSGLSNVDRITRLIATRPADPDVLTRRVFRCDLKHGSPWKRTLGKQGQQSHSQRSGDCLDLKIKERNTSWTSWKIVKLNGRYPKVVLCDVANNGVTLSQDCSYNLPHVLRTKLIRCFKQKMRAIYRFEPSCLHNAHQTQSEAAAKNRECCPSGGSERSICPSWRGTERQRHLRECTDAQTFPRHGTCSPPRELTSEGSAACSASFSAGEHSHGVGGRGAGVCDGGVGEDFRPGFPLARPDDLTEKRPHDARQSTPDLGNTAAARSDCDDGEELCSRVPDESQSWAEYALGKSASSGSLANKKGLAEELNSSVPLSEEEEMDKPASVSCQRVQAYARKRVFSCARTDMPWPFSDRLHNTASVCPSELIDPPDNSESPRNRNKPNTFTTPTNGGLSDAPKCFFPKPAPHDPPQNHWERRGEASAWQSNGENHELAPHLIAAERSQAGPASDGTDLSAIAVSPSLLPDVPPRTDSAASTPPPSALGLNDWGSGATLSSLSPPSAVPALSPQQRESSSVDSAEASFPSCLVQIVETPPFLSENPHRTCAAAPFSPSQSTDSSESCESFLLLPQDTSAHHVERESVPYISSSPVQPHRTKRMAPECALPSSGRPDAEFTLPPMLSPVSSPLVASMAGPLAGEPTQKATRSGESNTCDVSEVANARCGTSIGDAREVIPGLKPLSLSLTRAVSPLDAQKDSDSDEEQGQCETSEEGCPNRQVRTAGPAEVLQQPQSSSGSHDDDCRVGSFPSCSGGGMEQTNVEAAAALDEFLAFERDILLIDVTHDDPELFDNVPRESLINLGPTRSQETTQTARLLPGSCGASSALAQRLSTVNINYLCHSPDNAEDSSDRPWRPRCRSSCTKTQRNSMSSPDSLSEITVLTDDDLNNHAGEVFDRTQRIRTENSFNSNSSRGQNGPLSAEFRPYKYSPTCNKSTEQEYCRLYFSESLSCGYKVCRFLHVPAEGDEKFCTDTVRRFAKNPACLQKAGVIFTSYYHDNPPGVYFSMPVLLTLLWTQLRAGVISDVFSVLRVSVPHRIVPSCDFLLALFHDVRKKGHMNFMSELMQLTTQMVSAGLVLNLDFLDCIKNTPDVQQPVGSNSTTGMVFSAECSPDDLKLASAIVEIELCTRQEDWRGMGDVFRSICQSNHRPNQMEHISGRIVIALLADSKNKLLLPYVAFAQTVFKNKDENSLAWALFGRIGVSLMLRYHKTQQWAKGRKVVEVLIASKINYSKLKGLFGNEDGTSRCSRLTVAAELWLLCGSVEGALKTLRENNWFVSSSAWPCGTADLENRIHVLMRLAEKTSHRDTLEVLCNLPGLKEPNELIDISRFRPLFSAHLQTCVDRQVLPVASDAADFMLSKKMTVDGGTLQTLLQKLGKQSLWLKAREVFRHSLGEDYFPGLSAPPGSMSLVVPCRLGEVELALAMEMFITINASVILSLTEASGRSLTITLKRTQSVESEYLSAASRLLSASSVLLPKLLVQYTAVNPSQEQVFTVCPASARSWLRHNHGWAHEAWAN